MIKNLYSAVIFLLLLLFQVIVFEEEDSDHKLQFETAPDLGMTFDIQ